MKRHPLYIVTVRTVEGTWVPARATWLTFRHALSACFYALTVSQQDDLATRVEDANRTTIYATFAPGVKAVA